VITDLLKPMAWLLIVTTAPAATAPLGSVIVPRIPVSAD
jgi:hypothetical protein